MALRHVSKSYRAGTYALRDVSFEVGKGELVFLTGASGAGKTTLLRMLFAGERPSTGEVRVLGHDVARLRRRTIPALRRRVGVVFQDFELLPRMNVEENVRLALDVRGVPGREARARVFSALKQVGLHQWRHQDPRSLSGGEQQRVAIARALVGEPSLLLADEPTGNLDPALTIEIMDLIASVAARGTAVIVATHDLALVGRHGRRTLRLDAGRLAGDAALERVSV
ncbi:MAG: cell division ATP-binding protein FtsE [Deltaproteobacteria bacterium]|nr:cell division ATP-binding protein FtsE [Deltaproteobacteria bacterium]